MSDVTVTLSAEEVTALVDLLHRTGGHLQAAAVSETASDDWTLRELNVQVAAAGQALETTLSDAGIDYHPPEGHRPFYFFEL
jgi:hypothetical protein